MGDLTKSIRSSAEFVYVIAITIVVVGLALYVTNLLLHLSPLVMLIVSAGIGWTLVPSFIAIWVSLYSPQARMVAGEYMLSSRLRHYRLLNNHFFSKLDQFKERLPEKSSGGNAFASLFGLEWTYSLDKMKSSHMFDEGVNHLAADYGNEIVTKLLNLQDEVKEHGDKIRRVHDQLSSLLKKRFSDEGVQFPQESDSKVTSKQHAPSINVNSLCDMLAESWNDYFTDKREGSDLPSDRISLRLNANKSTSHGHSQPMVRLENTKSQYGEKVEAVVCEVADDREFLDKLRHLIVEKEEIYERTGEIARSFDGISDRIKGELYSTVAVCCPYRKIDL